MNAPIRHAGDKVISFSPERNHTQQLREILYNLRSAAGPRQTEGLTHSEIDSFLDTDLELRMAIHEASAEVNRWHKALRKDIRLPEAELAKKLQNGIVNFYGKSAVQPYIPLTARGAWIVTLHGAVILDAGGYGMLGLGHSPAQAIEERGHARPMLNVNAPSLEQRDMVSALEKHIGRNREARCPYKFIFMNSGSEANSVALRVSDIRTKMNLSKFGDPERVPVYSIALIGGFHGRTEGPARRSHSTSEKYHEHLASFRSHKDMIFVPPNDERALQRAFSFVKEKGGIVDSVILEPVMGEGNPGLAITPRFYSLARKLTRDRDSTLIIDSIQAAIRCTGNLSIIDYPGFERLAPPDIETFSKAINGGQFPVSVVGLSKRASEIYVDGVYGNTMTGNPCGLAVATEILEAITLKIRRNIVRQGAEMLLDLKALQRQFSKTVRSVQGTGLLLSMELDPRTHLVTGFRGLETWLRRRGLNIIHGGENALRFTPPFTLTNEQRDLMMNIVGEALSVFSRGKGSLSFQL